MTSHFIVQIELAAPDDLSAEALVSLRAQETVRARELAEAGALIRLWRIPTRWANIGLWAADDEAALRSTLDSLPLRSLMTITISPVVRHPSDPDGDCNQRTDQR